MDDELSLDDLVVRDRDHECEGFGRDRVCVKVVGVADLPSRFGTFRIVAFWNNRDAKEHVAIVHGNVLHESDVLTRLHSECLTGDVVGSLRCDCRDQPEVAPSASPPLPAGSSLYLRQEGRGIGLVSKIRAYALETRGWTPWRPTWPWGSATTSGTTPWPPTIHSLTLGSVQLMTNNPNKVSELTRHGITVAGRVPHVIPPNSFNRFYLETKASRSGHFIDVAGKPHLEEQGERVVVDGGAG